MEASPSTAVVPAVAYLAVTLRALATLVGRGIVALQILFSEVPERPPFPLVAQAAFSVHRDEGDVWGFPPFSSK